MSIGHTVTGAAILAVGMLVHSISSDPLPYAVIAQALLAPPTGTISEGHPVAPLLASLEQDYTPPEFVGISVGSFDAAQAKQAAEIRRNFCTKPCKIEPLGDQ